MKIHIYNSHVPHIIHLYTPVCAQLVHSNTSSVITRIELLFMPRAWKLTVELSTYVIMVNSIKALPKMWLYSDVQYSLGIYCTLWLSQIKLYYAGIMIIITCLISCMTNNFSPVHYHLASIIKIPNFRKIVVKLFSIVIMMHAYTLPHQFISYLINIIAHC